MKRLKAVDQAISCWWRVEGDEGEGYYWQGWCEDAKDGQRLDVLTLLPEHFTGRTIQETLYTCPDCGLEAFHDDDGWYCPSCE